MVIKNGNKVEKDFEKEQDYTEFFYLNAIFKNDNDDTFYKSYPDEIVNKKEY